MLMSIAVGEDPLLGAPIASNDHSVAGSRHGRRSGIDGGAKLASPQTSRPALMQEGPPSEESGRETVTLLESWYPRTLPALDKPTRM